MALSSVLPKTVWMKISLSDAGKRFNREWIFRHVSLEFLSSHAYAVTGPNGSGKSTFLQTIGGMLQASEGKIEYTIDNKQLANDEVFNYISFCAPYIEVIEEMTLTEFLHLHNRFKLFLKGLDTQKIIEIVGLQVAANMQLRYYSSGMKQRVKLAQAIFSDADVVLLDEPCSNLDASGIALYHSLIKTYCRERLVIVCSNDEVEYSFCEQRIEMMQLK